MSPLVSSTPSEARAVIFFRVDAQSLSSRNPSANAPLDLESELFLVSSVQALWKDDVGYM